MQVSDAACTTCGGTRRFTPRGKPNAIELDCPRCRQSGRRLETIPEE
ncbi:MAG: hypothetical protein ACYDBQ_02145 [Thermoplasmatota archaeon]